MTTKDILKRTWVSNGKSLMSEDKFPLYSGDFIRNCVCLSPQTIINAMMVDREYGKFLKEKIKK